MKKRMSYLSHSCDGLGVQQQPGQQRWGQQQEEQQQHQSGSIGHPLQPGYLEDCSSPIPPMLPACSSWKSTLFGTRTLGLVLRFVLRFVIHFFL